MTMVQPALLRVKQRLDAALPTAWIHQTLCAAGHVHRARQLSPARSIHLWILQLLANTSLAGLRRWQEGLPTAPALCQARRALPVSFFYALLGQLAAALKTPHAAGDALFHGLRIVLLDATSLRTPDTPELAGHYRKHTNGRRITPGYPAPKLLCLMDYASGLIYRAVDLPAHRQEHMLLRRIARCLQPLQLLVADRGLVSLPFLCALLTSKAHACLRLPLNMMATAGRPTALRSVQATLGRGDYLVLWRKASKPTCAHSAAAYRRLPAFLMLRQVTRPIVRDGFKTWTLTLVTTLVDPAAYPAEDLVKLYLKRWQVEVYFRDLKRAQGAAMLRSRSRAGVKKELLVHMLLYNLVRSLMREAALRLKIPAARLSFTDALRCLLHGRETQQLIINPHRQRPAEPRRIKTRRSKFPPLNQPRALYKPSIALTLHTNEGLT